MNTIIQHVSHSLSQLSIIRLKEVKVLSIKPIFICKQLTHGHFYLYG